MVANYTEQIQPSGDDSRGSNRATSAGNLPPFGNVNASCGNFWNGPRNSETAVGGEFLNTRGYFRAHRKDTKD